MTSPGPSFWIPASVSRPDLPRRRFRPAACPRPAAAAVVPALPPRSSATRTAPARAAPGCSPAPACTCFSRTSTTTRPTRCKPPSPLQRADPARLAGDPDRHPRGHQPSHGGRPLVWLGYLGETAWAAGCGVVLPARDQPVGDGADRRRQPPLLGRAAEPEHHQRREPGGAEQVGAASVRRGGALRLRPGSWDLLLGAGVRIARVSQEYNAFAGDGTNRLFPATLPRGRPDAGPGGPPAVRPQRAGAVYRRPRLAVFGSAHQTATCRPQPGFQDHRDPSLAIGELELGLEYGMPVGCSRLFARLAWSARSGSGSAARRAPR